MESRLRCGRSSFVLTRKVPPLKVLAGSNDEVVFDVLKATDSELWVSTGALETGVPFGRIYSVGRVDRKVSMVAQLKSRILTEFVEIGLAAPIVVVGAYGGRLTELKRNVARSGTYLTSPFHTEINARIGAIELAVPCRLAPP